MYAQLGDIVFERLSAPTSSEVEESTDLAQHAVVEGKPQIQVVGDALEQRRETIRFHRAFCDVEASIEALRAARRQHDPMSYVAGNGQVWGRFVIASMRTRTQVADDDGGVVAAEVELGLIEWPDAPVVETSSARRPGVRRASEPAEVGTRSGTVTASNPDGYTFTKIVRR